MLLTLEPHWDAWMGALALEGIDPRTWDLRQLLAAWETQLQRGAKDESEWNRTRSRLYAPLPGAKRRSSTQKVTGTERPARSGGLQAREAEAMLARMAAADAMFGGG